jgi:hypothetical protein
MSEAQVDKADRQQLVDFLTWLQARYDQLQKKDCPVKIYEGGEVVERIDWPEMDEWLRVVGLDELIDEYLAPKDADPESEEPEEPVPEKIPIDNVVKGQVVVNRNQRAGEVEYLLRFDINGRRFDVRVVQTDQELMEVLRYQSERSALLEVFARAFAAEVATALLESMIDAEQAEVKEGHVVA